MDNISLDEVLNNEILESYIVISPTDQVGFNNKSYSISYYTNDNHNNINFSFKRYDFFNDKITLFVRKTKTFLHNDTKSITLTFFDWDHFYNFFASDLNPNNSKKIFSLKDVFVDFLVPRNEYNFLCKTYGGQLFKLNEFIHIFNKLKNNLEFL